jgi:hydrogenase nickel incorporation protein HypB
MSVVTIERKVLEKNDALAAQNRARFREHGVFVFNLVSSPGSGKTSLLERTLATLKGQLRFGIIEGDVQTDLDAQRVGKYGVPVVQIVTNGACHLEAQLVRDAAAQLNVAELDVVVIENVGNLVCPAGYDLGEGLKVVLLSTTEGDDKPLKYPAMFRNASVLVVNKVDLLPYVPCDIDALVRNAHHVNPALSVFQTSCTTGAGIAEWCEWVRRQAAASRA